MGIVDIYMVYHLNVFFSGESLINGPRWKQMSIADIYIVPLLTDFSLGLRYPLHAWSNDRLPGPYLFLGLV